MKSTHGLAYRSKAQQPTDPKIFLSEEYQATFYSASNVSHPLYQEHLTSHDLYDNSHAQLLSPTSYISSGSNNDRLSPASSFYYSSPSDISTPATSPAPSYSSRSTRSPDWEPRPTSNRQPRVGLDTLNDPENPNARPSYTNKVLCEYAIKGSPQGRLSLSEIYTAVEARFPSLKRPEHRTWRYVHGSSHNNDPKICSLQGFSST
jgi:hypothetical protein